jgi:hypothetical protein
MHQDYFNNLTCLVDNWEHYYKMWVQFSSPRSLDQRIYCFFTCPVHCNQWIHLKSSEITSHTCYSGYAWILNFVFLVLLMLCVITPLALIWTNEQVTHWTMQSTNQLPYLRTCLITGWISPSYQVSMFWWFWFMCASFAPPKIWMQAFEEPGYV